MFLEAADRGNIETEYVINQVFHRRRGNKCFMVLVMHKHIGILRWNTSNYCLANESIRFPYYV